MAQVDPNLLARQAYQTAATGITDPLDFSAIERGLGRQEQKKRADEQAAMRKAEGVRKICPRPI